MKKSKPIDAYGRLVISYDILGPNEACVMVWRECHGVHTAVNNFFGQDAIDLFRWLNTPEEMRKPRMTDDQGYIFERVADGTYILRSGTEEVYRGPMKACIDEYERLLTEPDKNDA